MTDLEIGGVQTVNIGLANRLAEENCEIYLVTPNIGSTANYNINPKINIVYCPIATRKRILFLFNFLRQHKITIYISLFTKLRMIAVLFRIPQIVQILHNTYSYSKKEYLSEQFLKHFTEYVAVSQAVQIHAIKKLNLPDNKTRVIYNGIDLCRFDSSEPLKTTAPFKVVTIGRLVPQKGIDLYIELASKFTDTIGKIQFIIVGDGPLRESLEEQAKTVDPSGQLIQFYGSRLDVEEILKEAHLFVSTIRYGGFEIVLAEAMAMFVPVIGFDVGPVKEVIGTSGITVPFGDIYKMHAEIQNLIDNPKERIKRAQEARKWTEERYSISKVQNEYVDFLLNR